MDVKYKCSKCKIEFIAKDILCACGGEFLEGEICHQTAEVLGSNSTTLLERKEILRDDFRQIISHGMMGYDWVVGSDDFDQLIEALIEKATAF